MNELALFAGAGGGILGGHLLGWRTICAVEWDAYARDVLVARQNDGCLEAFPVWDDVQTFDGRPWRGRVDVISGGFPCQDISCAGKGAGIEGERSSMWKHMARIIGEVRPRFVFVENSPMLVGRGLAVVIADLAKMGYDAEWGIVGAHHAGAPHKRDRIWIVGNSSRWDGEESGVSLRQRKREPRGTSWGSGICQDVADSMRSRPQGSEWEREASEARQSTGHALQCCGGADVADTNGTGCKEQRRSISDGQEHETAECGGWWATEPDVGRVAYELAARVDRLRCIGNGQVPAVAKLAWETLTN
jgi:DNA (cytosine-5)-methyltransferase 1